MSANGASPPTEKVPGVHVANGVGTSVSDDGTTCAMIFRDANGKDFMLTFPTKGGLAAMRTMFANLMRDVARHDAGALGVPIRRIQTIQAQRHDGVRGHVLVILDANLPEETAVALPDVAAHQIGTTVRDLAAAGMTPEQRAKLKILAPPGSPKLILPG